MASCSDSKAAVGADIPVLILTLPGSLPSNLPRMSRSGSSRANLTVLLAKFVMREDAGTSFVFSLLSVLVLLEIRLQRTMTCSYRTSVSRTPPHESSSPCLKAGLHLCVSPFISFRLQSPADVTCAIPSSGLHPDRQPLNRRKALRPLDNRRPHLNAWSDWS